MGSSSSVPRQTETLFALEVLQLPCNCDGCWGKLKETVEKMPGVGRADVDKERRKITVSGEISAVDPAMVIHKVQADLRITAELIQPALSARNPEQHVNEEQPQISRDVPNPVKSPSISSITLTFSGCGSNNQQKHKLESKIFNKPFLCNLCREDGFGKRYRCCACESYELHPKCYSLQPSVTHPHFDGQRFHRLLQNPGTYDGQFCSACGRGIHGVTYYCSTADGRGLYLHPHCSDAKSKLIIDGTEIHLHKKVKSRCLWCQKKHLSGSQKQAPGWSYISACKNYHLHLYCVTELVNEAWKSLPEDESIELEVMGLNATAKARKGSDGGMGKGRSWMKLALFFRTVVGLLYGDPITMLAQVFVGLVTT